MTLDLHFGLNIEGKQHIITQMDKILFLDGHITKKELVIKEITKNT